MGVIDDHLVDREAVITDPEQVDEVAVTPGWVGAPLPAVDQDDKQTSAVDAPVTMLVLLLMAGCMATMNLHVGGEVAVGDVNQ